MDRHSGQREQPGQRFGVGKDADLGLGGQDGLNVTRLVRLELKLGPSSQGAREPWMGV